MKMNWNELVKSRMKTIGMTQDCLAERMGTSQATIARYLNRRREPDLDTIAKIMRVVGIDGVTLSSDGLVKDNRDNDESNITKMDIQPEYHGEYPILGAVSAGLFREAVQTHELDYLPTTERCSPDSYWLIVDGHSMTAHQGSGITFPEGMHILVDPNRDYSNNSFVVAYCEQKNQATFKKLSIEPEGTFLVPLNPDPVYKRINVEDEFCEIAGVVVDAKWKLF